MNVIEVENISKQYRLGLVNSQTVAADINRFWAKLRGREDPALKIGVENRIDTTDGKYVWALKDINFKVQQGEVLGIIGKNGAGKSTLLKILSKVTGPTTGNVKIKGRIASLLEVGTGFHPELTGKENIFLNGAILGMTKEEIKRKFDEILDFSGVGKYIDTPVKRYSSGMYVRLAFAVAAHLEHQILIVDEVLAVGDAEFQKKAIGKMQDVSRTDGRTVLFVSHNLTTINDLCSRCIFLKNGTIHMNDVTKKVVAHYISESLNIGKESIPLDNFPRALNKYGIRAKIKKLELAKNSFYWKEDPSFNFTVEFPHALISEVEFGFGVNAENGTRIFTYESESSFKIGSSRKLSMELSITEPTLVPGRYFISFGVRSYTDTLDAVENYLMFEILDVDKDANHFGFTQGPEISGYIDNVIKVSPL